MLNPVWMVPGVSVTVGLAPATVLAGDELEAKYDTRRPTFTGAAWLLSVMSVAEVSSLTRPCVDSAEMMALEPAQRLVDDAGAEMTMLPAPVAIGNAVFKPMVKGVSPLASVLYTLSQLIP